MSRASASVGEVAGSFSISVSRAGAFAAWLMIFNLAYIVSPYWLPPPAIWIRVVFLAGCASVGLVWAWAAADGLRLSVRAEGVAWAAVALATVVVLNWNAATREVAWMGDEDHHLLTTVGLVRLIRAWPGTFAGFAAVVIGFAGLAWRVRSIAWVAVAFVVIVVVEGLVATRVNTIPANLTRYPYLPYWFMALPVAGLQWVTNVLPPFSRGWEEAAYRIVPLVSAAMLGLVASGAGAMRGRPIGRWLLMLAVVTIPIVYYYSAIVYLELPAVVLMAIVCFDADALLTAPAGEIRGRPAWAGLVMIGFLKETTTPFLFAFVLCRVVSRWMKSRGRVEEVVRDEGRTAAAVLLPLMVWLVIRRIYPGPRDIPFRWENAADAGVIGTFLGAWVRQFGVLLGLAVVGLGLMWREGRIAAVAFGVLAFAGDAAIHVIDLPAFAGHARFSLFLLPPLLMMARPVVDAIGRWPAAGAGLIAAWVAVNLWMSPVYVDGSIVPFWADRVAASGEHSYPFREAVAWLRANGRGRRVVVGDFPHAYHFDLYDPPGMHIDQSGASDPIPMVPDPQRDALDLDATLEYAGRNGYDIAIHRVTGAVEPGIADLHGFAPSVVFQNRAHMLVLYERASAATRPGR